MKKFIRSRVRQVLMHFICYMPFSIYPWPLLPSQGSRRINFKNVASPHFTDQLIKTFHMCKTFRECPSKNFFTRAIQSATKLYNNEKDVKGEIKKKDVSF